LSILLIIGSHVHHDEREAVVGLERANVVDAGGDGIAE
jgi:hypothetical protein